MKYVILFLGGIIINAQILFAQSEVILQEKHTFIRQIEIFTLAGQPEKAAEYLDGVKFAYREGSSIVREIIIDAQLMRS